MKGTMPTLPLFYSITHLVPQHIEALNVLNKLSHDIYWSLMDRKRVSKCAAPVFSAFLW